MRDRTRPRSENPETGVGVGLLVASAVVPGTFARSLSDRTSLDQGIITGLSTGLHYLLTVGTQDALQAAAAELVAAGSGRRGDDVAGRQRRLTLLADLAVIPLGLGVTAALPARPGEAMLRGLLRQVGWRCAVTGIGGSLLISAEAALEGADRRLGGRGRLAAMPVAVPVGLGVAFALERRRQHQVVDAGMPLVRHPTAAARPLGFAGAVAGGLALAAYSEHALASTAGRRISAVLPGGPQLWKLTGHAACLGLLGAAGYSLYARAMRKIESGASADEPVMVLDEAERWTGPTVSGGTGSLVPWASLGREGRRHALTFVRPEPFIDRPEGVPDLSIETVMREPAKATPAQVYVRSGQCPHREGASRPGARRDCSHGPPAMGADCPSYGAVRSTPRAHGAPSRAPHSTPHRDRPRENHEDSQPGPNPNNSSAASYSPTPSPVQYHRR